MSYNVLKFLIFSFLVVYFVVGKYTERLPEAEWYPFFSWTLFSKIPALNEEYAVRIHEYEGKIFDPPIFFSQTQGVYSVSNTSITEYHFMIQLLGRSLKRNQEDEIIRRRQIFEANFLSHPVIYEVVKIKYDSIKYWKTGVMLGVESVAMLNSKNSSKE